MYMHRSTSLERLRKVEGILGVDMKNPDVRLQLSMLLKLLEIQKGDSTQKEKPKEKRQPPVLDYQELDHLI